MPASSLRLDLHNHTSFSADGLMSPAVLLSVAKVKGVHCLAVTDHNTVRGALEAVALAEADLTLPRVIPGIELATEVGEIIGLYVWEDIPSGLPLLEAVTRIRARAVSSTCPTRTICSGVVPFPGEPERSQPSSPTSSK